MPTYYQYVAPDPDYSTMFKVRADRIYQYEKISVFRFFRMWRLVNFWDRKSHPTIKITDKKVDDQGNGWVKIANLDGYHEEQDFNIYKYTHEFADEVTLKLAYPVYGDV